MVVIPNLEASFIAISNPFWISFFVIFGNSDATRSIALSLKTPDGSLELWYLSIIPPGGSFVSELIPIIIEQYNPLVYKYENDEGKVYELELNIKSPRITYPKVCDNDGTIHELSPSLARLRNYTYSSKLLVDICKKTRIYENNVLSEL